MRRRWTSRQAMMMMSCCGKRCRVLSSTCKTYLLADGLVDVVGLVTDLTFSQFIIVIGSMVEGFVSSLADLVAMLFGLVGVIDDFIVIVLLLVLAIIGYLIYRLQSGFSAGRGGESETSGEA